MKKLLVIATILMMVPFSAFAMDMMTDASMDDVTGQAGVSIGIDGTLSSSVNIQKFSFTDAGTVSLEATSGNLLELATTVEGVITMDVQDATLTNMSGTVIRVGLANATINTTPTLASNINVNLGTATLGTIGLGTVGITTTLPTAIEIGTH